MLNKLCNLKEDNPLYPMLVKGNPFLHMLLQCDDFGIVRLSQKSMAESCDMEKKEVKQYLEKLKEVGILVKHKDKEKKNGQWLTFERLKFNHDCDIFINPEDKLNPKRYQENGYPEDYGEDWKIYRGTDAEKIGNKAEAYPNWWMSVERYGHEAVTRGTRNYISKCEAHATWKKAAKNFWEPEAALFMEYQHNTKGGETALVALLHSKHLMGILEGAASYTVEGDDFIIEALLIMKGTEPTLGTVLDKIGDDRFRDRFIQCYEKALEKSAPPRRKLYAKRDNKVTWVMRDDEP